MADGQDEPGWGGFLTGLFTPKGSPDEKAAPAEPTTPPEPAFLSMPPEDIESFNAARAAELLAVATAATAVDVLRSRKHIELCCKRIRVLCREPATQKECYEAQAGAALVSAMDRCLPYLPSALAVQWHALGALVVVPNSFSRNVRSGMTA